MKEQSASNNGKIIYLEILRIISIFLVIFNHTGNYGFCLFTTKNPSMLSFWIDLFMSIACKIAVPLFFAISGALMLGRENETIRQIWTRRIVKILFILVFYSLFYYIVNNCLIGCGTFSIKQFVVLLYSGNIEYHLWYLYLYLAYLIMLPFLRSMVSKLSNIHYIYMFCLAVIINGILPVTEFLLFKGNYSLEPNLNISVVTNYAIVYPLLGYYMHNKVDCNKSRKSVVLLCIGFITSIFISSVMTYYKGIIDGGYSEQSSQTFHQSFAIVGCAAVFLSVKLIFRNKSLSKPFERFILSMGKCTFGIYLIHAFFRDMNLYGTVIRFLIDCGINTMICALIMSVILFFISYLITLCLSKIPLIRKIVGY